MRKPNVATSYFSGRALIILSGVVQAGAVYVHEGKVVGSLRATADLHITRQTNQSVSSEAGDRVESQPDLDIWNVTNSAGGNRKDLEWRKEKGGGAGVRISAFLFLGLLGCAPFVSHIRTGFSKSFTRWHALECAMFYAWLIGGYVAMTQYLVFQSPHFRRPRRLTSEEATYLMAQVVTTVGYGDVTPATSNGQTFFCFFVFFTIVLVAKLLGELVAFFEEKMEELFWDNPNELTGETKSCDWNLWKAMIPMLQSGSLVLLFIFIGAGFYSSYPGETKTPMQGVYMSVITLTSVGFGGFTPETHAGMVFGAYWMLFGVGAMASFASARVAFQAALVRNEREKLEREKSKPSNEPVDVQTCPRG
jgi:hypothetical protein